MQHLNQNQCLDLHIAHRNDPDFIDLLVRYEDLQHQIAGIKRTEARDNADIDIEVQGYKDSIEELKNENRELRDELAIAQAFANDLHKDLNLVAPKSALVG